MEPIPTKAGTWGENIEDTGQRHENSNPFYMKQVSLQFVQIFLLEPGTEDVSPQLAPYSHAEVLGIVV